MASQIAIWQGSLYYRVYGYESGVLILYHEFKSIQWDTTVFSYQFLVYDFATSFRVKIQFDNFWS